MAALAALLFAGLSLVSPSAEAKTFTVDCGSFRTVNLARPKTLFVRVANLGDCSVGLILRDTFGVEVVNTVINPRETNDFSTLSAQIAQGTLIAGNEGTDGVVLQVRPITDGTSVALPNDGGFFDCDGNRFISVYQCGDGDACQQVTYRISNSPTGCRLTVRFQYDATGASEHTLLGGQSVQNSGRLLYVRVNCESDTPLTNCRYSYTRNP